MPYKTIHSLRGLAIIILGSALAHAGITVHGTILDPQDKPVAGADVMLRPTVSPATVVATAQTHADGAYSFNDVAPGDYELDVTSDGFTTLTRSLTIGQESQRVDLQFTAIIRHNESIV